MEYEGIVKEVFIPDSVDTLKTNKIGFKVYVYELDKEITVEELQDEYNIDIYKDDNVVVIEDKEEYINVLNKMINRLSFALIIAGMVVGSSLILNRNPEPQIYGISIIGMGGYFVSAILGLWLLISIIRSGSLK